MNTVKKKPSVSHLSVILKIMACPCHVSSSEDENTLIMNSTKDAIIRFTGEVVPGMIVTGMEVAEIEGAPRMDLIKCGKSCYEIHHNAYIKLVLSPKPLHLRCQRHLPGRSATSEVEIVDSVPLFHSHIGLLPPLEITLIMPSRPPPSPPPPPSYLAKAVYFPNFIGPHFLLSVQTSMLLNARARRSHNGAVVRE